MSLQLNASEKEEASAWLSEIISFPTVSGEGPLNGSYNTCANWILNKLLSIGLDAKILPESGCNKPIVIASWIGSSPSLPVIVLNSHYDVVPGKILNIWYI